MSTELRDLGSRFGRSTVTSGERRRRVRGLFDRIAPSYDRMNDLMSGGLHRLWKRRAADIAAGLAAERSGPVLDLAAGTGDIARLIADRLPGRRVVMCDASPAMVARGARRTGAASVAGEGEALPFARAAFGLVTLAFGLRNMTDPGLCLAEIARVLAPGGALVILEFSQPSTWFRPFYAAYSRLIIPGLGSAIARDRGAYVYLVESIAIFPDARAVSAALAAAGFRVDRVDRLMFGAVAIHVASLTEEQREGVMKRVALDRGGTGAPPPLVASSRLAVWVLAARPRTLVLSAVPVLAGTFLAMAGDRGWRLEVLVLALVAAVAIQIGTNLWNDAADFESGVDTATRIGPVRVTAMGLASIRTVKTAALLCFSIATAAGAVLAVIGGWPIVAVGLASLAAGYAYSMGPYPLSRTPFGEVLVVLFFGVVAVAGTYYLHTGTVDRTALFLGLVLGLPAAAVLLVNNHRDRVSDSIAGRRTLAILLGPTGTRILFALLLVATLLGAARFAGSAREFVFLVPLALVYAWLIRDMIRLAVSPALNRLLSRTGASQIILLATIVALTAINL